MRLRNRNLLGTIPYGPPLRDSGHEDPALPPTDPPKDDDKGEKDGLPEFDGEFDADRAKRALKASRDKEAEARAKAKAEKERADKSDKEAQELRDKLGIALGFKPDPSKDPSQALAEATKSIADKDERIANLTRDNALIVAAHKVGADAAELRDSSSFMKKLTGIDTNADDYESQVEKVVKQAVKDNPRFGTEKAPTGKARMGNDHTGGNTGGRTRKGLGGAIDAAMNP